MNRSLLREAIVALGAVVLWTAGVLAQTGSATAPLSGVVVDKDGGAMAGVNVTVKNNGTEITRPVVTNASGVFSVAALDPGSYTVTASMRGFKTVVMSDVRMVTATPASVRILLEVGPVSETVVVPARTELIQTQSTAITSTVDANQIRNLPLITRNALNYVTFLPGVDSAAGSHVQRSSTISGLPQSALAISIDGVNSQDNWVKSADGFSSQISVSVDAVQEVTVSSATPGADASGQGAVQIKFTTRSGTSKYTGSLFEYYRDQKLNANSYFNILNGLPKAGITVNQFGGNVGGPLVLPRFNRAKVFFFQNYEEFRQPSSTPRTRIIMNPLAAQGVFTYTAGGVTQQVNVLALGLANGFPSAPDPTVAHILADISAAATGDRQGTITPNADPNTSSYNMNAPSYATRHFPTTKIDVNFADAHRFSASYYLQKFNSDPDLLNNNEPKFPGFPNHGAQYSWRNAVTGALRSSLSPNMVNEAVFGLITAPVYGFFDETPAQFQNQGGYALGLAGGTAFGSLTIPTSGGNTPAAANGNNVEARNGGDWSVSDTLSWQHGAHSFQFGGNFVKATGWIEDRQLVPAVSFGLDPTNDPANALFNGALGAASFPGASSAQLADARFLYSLLTGRVNQIVNQLALDQKTNQYVNNGLGVRQTHMNELGLFVQDAWRIRPNLTLNYGVRYELQLPVQADNSLYAMNTIADACGQSGPGNRFGTACNLFTPGTLTGLQPSFKRLVAGEPGYTIDDNNFAPSVGAAWLPRVQSGLMRSILGDPDQATIRAAYARSYIREGLQAMAMPYESNPGVLVVQTRSQANGNLVNDGGAWPLLLSQTSRMGPADFVPTQSYPIPITRGLGFSTNLFDPDFQVGAVDSYSLGWQRALGKDSAIEIRYVGTRGKRLRETEDWNETNLVENGFLNEFKAAQANLYANMSQRNLQSFAYQGPGTGTTPLPIYLAYLNGLPSSRAGDPASYTGASWVSSTLLSRFASLNPNPGSSASTDILNNATFRANAITAGLPANFFVLNPDATRVNVQVSKGYTKYDALQIDFRRRLSGGLAVNANFTRSARYADRLDSLRADRYLVESTSEVPNQLKATVNYEIPIGRGRLFGGGMSTWADRLAGGWAVSLSGRVSSGAVLDFGNVRLVGMTIGELQDAVEYRIEPSTPTSPTKVYNLPKDIIDNTVNAFKIGLNGYTGDAPTGRYFAPANGPNCIQVVRGDCAPKDLIVTAPIYSRFDISAKKAIKTGPKGTFLFEVDVFNLFNAINFNPNSAASGSSSDSFRVTTSYSDVTGTLDPGSRVGQIVLRFNF